MDYQYFKTDQVWGLTFPCNKDYIWTFLREDGVNKIAEVTPGSSEMIMHPMKGVTVDEALSFMREQVEKHLGENHHHIKAYGIESPEGVQVVVLDLERKSRLKIKEKSDIVVLDYYRSLELESNEEMTNAKS